MLDVHPPHQAAHTWTDFFIHIATIVLGLIIAVGLEQTLELVHHRHEIRDAREALAAEHQENIRRYHQNIRDHLLRLANQSSDQDVLRYLLVHPGTPQERLPGVMNFGSITLNEPVESAWSTVEHSDVASLLPSAELENLANEYKQLDRESQYFQNQLQPYLTDCADYLTHTADITDTNPPEQQQTLNCIVLMQGRETVFGDQLSVIGDLNGYGPPIDYWKMIPFFHMAEQHRFGDTHPATNAPTELKRKQALSVLQAPTDKQ
jgi:FtsZ-binding cell division protein ZapB